ncbi:MAG: type I 3-dehydroquinate dehydratase, partial [Gemmatimonadota bacterium]|nr:type I 3-dehydroquinate dehydratase [Gemmatimonadota bacterium]
MLCVTGSEANAEALHRRLVAVERRLHGTEFLQEVRLDHLPDPEPVVAGLRAYARRLVVTCRPSRQGGGYTGSEEARLALLHDAASIGPRYVDLEADCPHQAAGSLREAGSGGIVVSWHLWENDPERVKRAVERLAAHEADTRKLAVVVDDAADLHPLRQLSDLTPGLFVIGMGAPGALSRCRYPAFGARWTYVAADPADATAPGQLSLDEALAMGLPAAASLPFVCLLGGPQIAHSPGPRCYNRLFRQKGAPWSYVPVVSTRGLDALSL